MCMHVSVVSPLILLLIIVGCFFFYALGIALLLSRTTLFLMQFLHNFYWVWLLFRITSCHKLIPSLLWNFCDANSYHILQFAMQTYRIPCEMYRHVSLLTVWVNSVPEDGRQRARKQIHRFSLYFPSIYRLKSNPLNSLLSNFIFIDRQLKLSVNMIMRISLFSSLLRSWICRL